jgi:hypothetical protein
MSQVNKEHNYAVGIILQGCFTPIESYETAEELKQGFSRWYMFAYRKEITKPIMVEKADTKAEWTDAKCLVLEELMNKSILEIN